MPRPPTCAANPSRLDCQVKPGNDEFARISPPYPSCPGLTRASSGIDRKRRASTLSGIEIAPDTAA